MSTIEQALAGRRIALPETRELDVFADLLTRRGARVLRCPMVSILDAPDPAPVLAWIRGFNAGGCDDLILLTGEGLKRLLSCMDRHAPALREPFLQRLGAVRKIVRGPKPARVLRELGLKPEISAVAPTTAGIIATLATENLSRRRVGVQLYGTEPNLLLMDFLAGAGAIALPVAPYIYADASAQGQVLDLIAEMASGRVDAIAFTSMAQVQRLFAVARDAAREPELQAGLERTQVAAIGPVVADALKERAVRVDLVPEGSFFLKPLTQALCERLGAAPG